MEKENQYKQIDFFHEDFNQFDIDDIDELNVGYHEINNPDNENYQSSSRGSSPPQDFDINADLQYMPINDEYDSPTPIDELQHSSASSLSLGSDHDLTSNKPVTLSKTCRVIRCPECEKPMRTFYCAKCIQKGKFVTLGTFVDENLQISKKTTQLEPSLTSKCVSIDENELLEESIQVRLRTLKRKTEALQNLYNSRRLELDETKKLIEATKTQIKLDRKSNRSKESKIELIKRYITSRKASIKKRRDAEANLVDELRQHIHRRIFQLTNDVFPIEEINLLEHNNSIVNMETSPLLTFSDGSHSLIEHQTAYSIVEPWLPTNGDYSAYSLWVNMNQDHITAPISDTSERNPAFRIGAGLAYTTQLVKTIATYLDVILPARIDSKTFNRELLDDAHFSYNVAKLNANVIHLCVSQGVDVSLLSPQKTLKNLMLLFNLNVCELGQKPIIELDNEEAATRIGEQLSPDLSLVQDDFYDFSKFIEDDDISDSEWEISESITPMEMQMQMATEQSIQQNSSYISRLPLRLLASFWSTGGGAT